MRKRFCLSCSSFKPVDCFDSANLAIRNICDVCRGLKSRGLDTRQGRGPETPEEHKVFEDWQAGRYVAPICEVDEVDALPS